MHITGPVNFSGITNVGQLGSWISNFAQNTKQQINGNLSLKHNLMAKVIPVYFTSANTSYSIAHTVQGTPTGYFPIRLSASASIFDGVATGTTLVLGPTYAYLQCSASGISALIVFIM